MNRTFLIAAVTLAGFTAPAFSMDDTERARQMEIYSAHQQTGVAAVTTTTAVAAPVQASAQGSAVQGRAQMAPLSDSGQPMTGLKPEAETLGTVSETAQAGAAPAVVTTTGFEAGRKSQRQREMEAYEAWKSGQQPQAAAVPAQPPVAVVTTAVAQPPVVTTTTTTAPAQPVVIPADQLGMAAAPVTITGPSTTTTEKTTTTNYTVTTRKVGIVGKRPYPAATSQLTGGSTKEVIVNGVSAGAQVVTPDSVAPLKDQTAQGDYYSNQPAAEVYKGTVGNVRVHKTGQFN